MELGLCGPSELTVRRCRNDTVAADRLSTPVRADRELRDRLLRALPLERRAVENRITTDLANEIMSYLADDRFITRTVNGGLMHSTTKSMNVDFFFNTVPRVAPGASATKVLREALTKAWAEDNELCLKLIFHLGARCGKQDRWSFYDAMVWLWEVSPGTVLQNLQHVPEANYWKALLEFVARVSEGETKTLERDTVLHKAHVAKRPMLLAKDAPGWKCTHVYADEIGWDGGSRLQHGERVVKKYDRDPLFRALYRKVSELFAKQLKEDLKTSAAGEPTSLCGKWAPMPYKSYDRRTLLSEGIARELFPRSEFPGLTEAQYAYRARDRLRGVLNQLREHKRVPERLLHSGRASAINYKTVPGACLEKNAALFLRHDEARFMRFLESGTKKNCGSRQPHEIVKATRDKSLAPRLLAEAQWRTLSAQFTGKNAIAVCDVSGSMCTPATTTASCMDVAIALTLMIAQCEGAAKDMAITFESNPRICSLKGTTLKDRAEELLRMPWGGTTNFRKTFELLIDIPVERIFVFSDMNFDQAGGNMTDFEYGRKFFATHGKEFPEVIFWNLSRGYGAPAQADTKGAVLLSGFSSALLSSAFGLDCGEAEGQTTPEAKKETKEKVKRTPLETVLTMVEKPLFQQLQIVDDRVALERILRHPVLLGPEEKSAVRASLAAAARAVAALPPATEAKSLGRRFLDWMFNYSSDDHGPLEDSEMCDVFTVEDSQADNNRAKKKVAQKCSRSLRVEARKTQFGTELRRVVYQQAKARRKRCAARLAARTAKATRAA
jgi:hypothetical protein